MRANTQPRGLAGGSHVETAEILERPLLWWRVPERPGVGAAMLWNTAVWFVSMILLFVLIEVVR